MCAIIIVCNIFSLQMQPILYIRNWPVTNFALNISRVVPCNKFRTRYFDKSVRTWAFLHPLGLFSCTFPAADFHIQNMEKYWHMPIVKTMHSAFFENFYIYHNFIFKGATQNNKNISLTFTKMKSWKLNFVTLSLRIYGSVFYNIFNTKVFKLPL